MNTNTNNTNTDDDTNDYGYTYTNTPSSVWKMIGTMMITVVEIHVLILTYFTYYTLSAHWE